MNLLILKKDSILEFDTLEEIREFDPEFQDFVNENLEETEAAIKAFILEQKEK